MQGRSWMAALTLAAGTLLAPDARAGEPPATGSEVLAPNAPVSRVWLDLRIAGLMRDGCDVEIKPAHAGCKFTPVRKHVDQGGLARLLFENVEAHGADRDCAFAITIKEPGQPERTVRRGIRLVATARGKIPELGCFMSSPSKLAKMNEDRPRR